MTTGDGDLATNSSVVHYMSILMSKVMSGQIVGSVYMMELIPLGEFFLLTLLSHNGIPSLRQ